MKNRLISLWYLVRYSLWFVPGLMVAAALVLAYITAGLDETLHPLGDGRLWWIYEGTPAGARAVLSTIAGSMITVAGVVFSLTMVVLSLTSSQFGPRLVRNFMDDTGNQLVLGTFVATFVYCLVELRTIEGSGSAPLPSLSVSVGLALALASLGVLIYFIHHIASSIQANNLLARVGHEFEDSVRRLFPEATDGPATWPTPELPQGFAQRAGELWARQSGYVQMIDHGRLYDLACEQNLLIQVTRRPGDFVINGNPLCLVWPPESFTSALAVRLQRSFTMGVERTEAQDVEYVARLLAETALRSLSPGVNDPYTAVTCIDWLGSGLALLAGRGRRPAFRLDEGGELRLVYQEVSFPLVAESCLEPIRRAARENVMCTVRLLEVLAALARQVRLPQDHQVLVHQAQAVKTDSLDNLKLAWDRDLISGKHQEVLRELDLAALRLEPPEAQRREKG
ncbi:MAG: DUF2254 domain-containing protein [Desulfarculaceae bacterium]|nr:DUF2254 domain-containing protein [Desulfarculaceae bacterium]MCF8047990.1 DUF2254 domain-containing protein [Desulfarculaceae bacterium]MCF8064221.1 DUF2254 domain-containing protein [Desulfarculaceae bacterium]MCF8098017.1 DUF2254 domain-containing protein [Desulfarculaceae bacterium]MCF8122937.1 DUF2254 domain-containing protein [Desulfarculaceae bacterium]